MASSAPLLVSDSLSGLFTSSKPYSAPPIKTNRRVGSSSSFLDLQPESSPKPLAIPLEWHDPSTSYDAAILGCGPAGLRLAGLASSHGLRICCIDPAPLSSWPNNYGCWADELSLLGLSSSLDRIWPSATAVFEEGNSAHIPRPYARVSRSALKTFLLESCVSTGVRFHRSCALAVDHREFSSAVSCSDGSLISASLVVDATGFASPFLDYPPGAKRDHGYQIAHGILAEVDSHPFDLDQMVLMDWSDGHMGSEPYLRPSNRRAPSFLYAMPLDDRFVFLEETSLVGRPMHGYDEIKKRMAARLRHLGIRVRRVIEVEKCVIPLGGPLPRIPQRVVGFGGAAGMAHPSTGYMMARSLEIAPAVAQAMAECLGSARMIRGKGMQERIWASVWTPERQAEREFYRFGMETLLRLDLVGIREFFEAFFKLDASYYQGFLSSRLSLGELAELSFQLFVKSSSRTRADIITKCPLPLARMAGNLARQLI